MIEVLQIGLGSNPGGIENCILNYHKYIDSSKICFDYVDIYGKGIAYSGEILKLGGKIFILPNYKRYPFMAARKLKEIILYHPYDVIHINMLSAANLIPVGVACRNSGGRVVVHSHNTSVPFGVLRPVMNKINLCKLRRMPVEKWGCGIEAGRWMWGDDFESDNIVPNAIEADKFVRNPEKRKLLRKQCGFGRGDIVIGFVGRFSEQKNVFFLAEILSCLKKKSAKYKLLLVGDGKLKKALKERFRERNVANDVYFAGIQSEVFIWYQAMDAFVLPSLFEGVPIVGIEAQAAGIPCFISDRVSNELDITGTVEYLPIDGGGGIWADTIDKCLERDTQRTNEFPKEYQICYAVKQLQRRYEKLAVDKGKECIAE